MSATLGRIGWAPAWASAWGEDEFGLWAEFSYKEVVQRMRWIAPGKFWMGSPEDEPDRRSDEVLHEVELTNGYWLADTACTQDLWVAVMGENPSTFRERAEGENSRPVENVSWDNCQEFLRRLNGEMPGLELRLPTEAEWENACRAGTRTPFSFGANITPAQVNYYGNVPYVGGKKGEYRAKTVPVKTLPANPWGLFEMHGNVLEWCRDAPRAYQAGSAVDPIGAPDDQTKPGRVARGGAWSNIARSTRSANRSGGDRGVGGSHLGFRIARGRPVR